ncbi:MAG: methionyl-tRNA formyltransferase [Chloroflexi bacterium RBG_16_58_14]|nr:MAG: methionyl-tRNA formyltransferase [Chloroflexi bacterium RBG_16_58_14]
MQGMQPRIVFMGSPAFALPSLQALAGRYPVVGVVTQPDRPAGRGRSAAPPPVINLAKALGLRVIQPERLKEESALQQLQSWKPALIVVVAFGQILPPAVLDLPSRGCLNLHASLLPRWRGAAPVQAAILNGDVVTGVTLLKMDPGVDTGPLLAQRPLPILPDDTAGSLAQRLAELGAALLIESLPAYLDSSLQSQAQDASQATYAPMLKKGDGMLNFNLPAEALARRVRAYNPWPGAFFTWQDQPLKVHRAHFVQAEPAVPGRRTAHASLPAVHTADGLLVLDEVQPAGKRAMTGQAFLLGARSWTSQESDGLRSA